MSLQSLITAHESATFDNAPSGFVLSTAAQGAGKIYEFLGEQPLTKTASTVVPNARGGVKITPASGIGGMGTAETLFDTASTFAFEVKVSKASLASGQYFFGISAATVAVTTSSPLSANAVVNNSIGFYINSGDLSSVVPTSKATGSQVDKASVAINAGVYVRLGVKYDPADRGIRFFVDGQEVASESTAVPASGTQLRVIIGGTTNGDIVNCDYVAVAVKR